MFGTRKGVGRISQPFSFLPLSLIPPFAVVTAANSYLLPKWGWRMVLSHVELAMGVGQSSVPGAPSSWLPPEG